MSKPCILFSLTLWSTFCAFAQDASQSSLRENLRPPATQKLLFQLHAVGDQIYTCAAAPADKYVWTLKAPEAQLLAPDGQPFGHHFAGPTWEAKDGSRVVGKPLALAPSPDTRSIPWLLLEAVHHEGQGSMTEVLTIQRLNTKGGKPPAAGCDLSHIGSETRVPYQADYYFYGATK